MIKLLIKVDNKGVKEGKGLNASRQWQMRPRVRVTDDAENVF